MFKNKPSENSNNVCGRRIRALRLAMPHKVSQRAFADQLQLAGLDLDKNAVQRMEIGKRFVTDYELQIIARVLGTTTDELLNNPEKN